MKRFIALWLGMLFVAVSGAEEIHPGLTAGAARVNITPPVGIALSGWAARDRPSDAIADELFAKALVISDGQTTVAILTLDLLKTFQNIVDSVRQEVWRRTGISPNNILLTASHTHFSPLVDLQGTGPYEQAYASTLIGKLAGAVQMAWQNRQPAWIGAGRGLAPEFTFNRRVVRADGTVFNSWRFPADTSGLTLGPIDPTVGVLRVLSADDRPIATLINYASHPVCGMNEMYALSADYPAFAAQVVEEIEGGICLFALGTAGNQVPIEREGRSRVEIGRGVGAAALQALQRLPVYNGFPIATARRVIQLPTKKNVFVDAKTIDLEIQVLALGDMVFVALPGEVVVELGLDLKARAGLENLFILELANGGNVGYILSRQDYDDGGYEALNGALQPGSGERIIDEALELIAGLAKTTAAQKTVKSRGQESDFGNFSQKGYDLTRQKLEKKP